MKRVMLIAVLIVLGGCAQLEQQASHMQSSMVKIRREILWLDCEGDTLGLWRGNYNIESDGDSYRFMESGKAITISGVVRIEELGGDDARPNKGFYSIP